MLTKEQHRVTRAVFSFDKDFVEELITMPESAIYKRDRSAKDPLFEKAMNFASWFRIRYANNPDLHRIEQDVALGIGNARSLASIYNKLLNGELIGKELMKKFTTIVSTETDFVADWIGAFGFGHFNLNGIKGFGHNGYGCQEAIAIPERDIVIAYVTNGAKVGTVPNCRTFARITNALLKLIIENHFEA